MHKWFYKLYISSNHSAKLDYLPLPSSQQDNIFKLEDSHFENGRGKSPYDPKLLTASLLIGM